MLPAGIKVYVGLKNVLPGLGFLYGTSKILHY